jgi:hypothetical protein
MIHTVLRTARLAYRNVVVAGVDIFGIRQHVVGFPSDDILQEKAGTLFLRIPEPGTGRFTSELAFRFDDLNFVEVTY